MEKTKRIFKKLKLVRDSAPSMYVTSPNSADSILSQFKMFSKDEPVEHFVLIGLGNGNEVNILKKWEGEVNKTSVYVSEIAKYLLLSNCKACLLAHNHPSGKTKPSNEDIQITVTIKKALDLFDIVVHDHLIYAGDEVISLRKEGLI